MDFIDSSVFICAGILPTEVDISTWAFHPSNVKIYLYLVDSEYEYVLSGNKDVVQGLKEHSPCLLLYLNRFHRLNSINLNFYWACTM